MRSMLKRFTAFSMAACLMLSMPGMRLQAAENEAATDVILEESKEITADEEEMTEVENCQEADNQEEISEENQTTETTVIQEESQEGYQTAAASDEMEYEGFDIEDGVLLEYYGTDTEVVIPEGIETIAAYAFAYCDTMKKVTMPESLINIDEYAFRNCDGLEEVTISDYVGKIGNYAFAGCKKLKKVTLGEYVAEIGDYSFSDCSALEKVNIADSTHAIGKYAFQRCTSLKEIHIPVGITSVGKQAFAGCDKMENVTVAEDNIYYSAIDGILYNKDQSILYYCPVTKEGDLIIHANVNNIDEYAFMNCTKINTVYIPENVKWIGKAAFSGCASLSTISLPDGITYISENLFENCTSLTQVKVPENVNSIGKNAFAGCTGLLNITIPQGLEEIHEYAFADCSSLTDVYFEGDAYLWRDIIVEIGNDPFTKAKVTFVYEPVYTIKLSQTTYTYNGTERKPSVYVREDGVKLEKNKDFTVQYLHNVEVGTAVALVIGKGDFAGVLYQTYIIRPKATSLISVSNPVGRELQIKWNEGEDVDGYEIKYSTQEKFQDATTKVIAGQENTSYELSNRTIGKRYYVRVRTYKVVDGEKYYSLWSEYKSSYVVPPMHYFSVSNEEAGVIHANWALNTYSIDGYELVVANDESFSKIAKKYDLAKETFIQDITGRTVGKTYYVRLRSYVKNSAGEKVYSQWTETQAITIEK